MAVALGLLYLQVKFAFVAGLVVIVLLIPGSLGSLLLQCDEC